MEFVRSACAFSKAHSTPIIVIFLLTAFVGKGDSFIFTETRSAPIFTQLNLVLLAAARSLLALKISWTLHLTFLHKPFAPRKCASSTSMQSYSALFKYVSVFASCFGAPHILLKSILVLLLFAGPFPVLLVAALKLNQRIQKYLRDSAQPPPGEGVGLDGNVGSPHRRTRSGMVFGTFPTEEEMARLRDKSEERKRMAIINRPRSKRKGQ